MTKRDMKALLVQEPSREREGIEFFFLRSGLAIDTADSANAMYRLAGDHDYDAVIIAAHDDAQTLIRNAVARLEAPVVAIVPGEDAERRVRVLEAGAADVLQRPIDPRELVLRVRNAAERAGAMGVKPAEGAGTRSFGPWRVDAVRRDVIHEDGRAAQLTGGEYELLKAFLERPNRPLSRDLIMQATRGRTWKPFDRSIDVLVGRLRRKIEADPDQPSLIKTVRGIGYVLAAPVRSASTAAGLIGGSADDGVGASGERPAAGAFVQIVS